MSPPATILITGSNVGIGFDTARQFALIETTKKVILACRNAEKAEAAKKDLESKTGKQIFQVLIMDVSSLDSVRKAVGEISEPIHAMVMNAGGVCAKDATVKTKDGVTTIMATNVLGHVCLVDELLKKGHLSKGATVLFVGSESSRGMPDMGVARPKIESASVEEFKSVADGSFFGDVKTVDATYGVTKLVGSLWINHMARKHKDMRFLTMSPGMTAGTEAFKDMPMFEKILYKILFPIMGFLGKSHSLSTGAKRFVDAVLEEDTYKSGVFYGSKVGVSGPVGDQAEMWDILKNESAQDNATEALHAFL